MTRSQIAPQPLTPAEVVALCRELRNVIAAGVPLHLGLQSGAAATARLEQVLERLVERTTHGADLVSAMESESASIPPVLRGVVLAGLRSGRLEELLEDLTQTTQAFNHLKQLLLRSLFYPVCVILLAALLSQLIFPRLFSGLRGSFEGMPPQGIAAFVLNNEWWIINGGWIALAIIAVVWMVGLSISRLRGEEVAGWGLLSQLPIVSRVIRDRTLARVIRLLALLVKYEVPLPEALRISGAATADLQFRRELDSLAEQAATGNEFRYERTTRIPRFLQWMISIGQRESRLYTSLQDAADFYQTRAIFHAEWVARFVPAIFLVVFGGGFTLLYSLAAYGPLMSLWKQLGAS